MSEVTLPKEANIHVSEYKLYLPSKEELQRQQQAVEAEFENQLSAGEVQDVD